MQVKVRIDDPQPIIASLDNDEIEIMYHRHYHEHDTYMLFNDPAQGMVRYREDDFMDKDGEVDHTRYRLTLIGASHHGEFSTDVLLSRSRYLAPAPQSLRFYREYFTPDREIFIEKDRLRWLVKYKDTEFYVNIDRVDQPDLGHFLEVKSRTWSRNDADRKSELVAELVSFLGASPTETVPQDYTEIVAAAD